MIRKSTRNKKPLMRLITQTDSIDFIPTEELNKLNNNNYSNKLLLAKLRKFNRITTGDKINSVGKLSMLVIIRNKSNKENLTLEAMVSNI